jgi:hypothetical protein
VDLTGGAGISLGANVSAGGDITVTAAAGDLAVNAAVASAAGAVSLSAGGANGINLAANVSAAGGIAFTAAPSNKVTVTGTAAVNSGGTITFSTDLIVNPSPGNLTLNGTVAIAGNVTLNGTLSAGPAAASNIAITVDGNWAQTGVFYPRNGKVVFTNTAVTIDAVNTTWYDLVFAPAAAALIKFRNYPDTVYDSATRLGHHVAGKLSNSTAHALTLTRLSPVVSDDADARALTPDSFDESTLNNGQADKFWNLFYDPDNNDAFRELTNTKVDWSWVRPRIAKSPAEMPIPDIGEWVRPQDDGYAASDHRYNVGWRAPYLIYSFTEDWNHNGRIDHIRIQSYSPLSGSFSGFEAEVEGYTVKGYSRPATGDPLDKYLFYIELEEKDYSDTDQRPRWDLKEGDLYDELRFRVFESAKTPIDTAPPQVVYSLALAGGNEIFIRMSEPVEFAAGFSAQASLTINGAAGAYAVNPVTYLPGRGLLEFTIGNIPALQAAVLAGEANFEFAASSSGYFHDESKTFSYPPFIGNEGLADCPLIWPKREYGYRGGAAYENRAGSGSWPPYWQTPPWTGGPAWVLSESNYNVRNGGPSYDYVHRLSDLFIAPPPANAQGPFFVLPVYAHDFTASEDFNPGARIFEFDGTRQLLDMDIAVQAKMHDSTAAVPGITGLELRFASSKRIPPEDRSNLEQHGIEGLWLPGPAAPGLAPHPHGGAGSGLGDPSPGNRLYNFTVPNDALVSGGDLEFYFHLVGSSPELYVARLDSANSNSVPWYRRIKPFSFRLREVVSQRSSVTVLNNVINPDRGDSVILHYVLTRSGRVTIQVSTLDGNLVRVLERSSKGAGEYSAAWDGRNNGGRAVARGMYFIRIVGPDIDEIRKVMVVK